MARKVMIIIAIMCVCLSMTSNAFAYTSYDEGTISTTYVQYFDDIVDGLPITHNYVATRSGQYEYILHASDSLKLADGVFISDNGTTYKITTSSGFNSTYVYNVLNEQQFTLDTNNQMVYSNIGDYPRLDERGSNFEYVLMFTAFVCCLSLLIRPIFKYVLRIR